MSEPLHVPCPRCLAANRVPRERLGERPVCGRCKAALFDAHPVELGSDSFARYVERSDLPVVVDFWAAWCAPCRAMAPQFAAAAQASLGRVLFAKLDTEAAQDVAARLGIGSIPTMILFRDGRELARTSGALSSQQILAWLSAELS